MAVYDLMHKDQVCAKLNIDKGSGQVLSVLGETEPSLLVPRCALSERDFLQWWSERAVPNTRKDLKPWLDDHGAEIAGEFLLQNLGLSLTDCYWVRPEGVGLSWKEVNLFDNDFVECFTPMRDQKNGDSRFPYTPDASTGGDLPKWWLVHDGIRYLVKGNDGATSQQSLNEVLATAIHEKLGWENHVPYEILKSGDGRLLCRCPCFTSEKKEFIPAWDLVGRSGYAKDEPFREKFLSACVSGGLTEREVNEFLDYQAITDFIMSNGDRHLNNFGVLRDSDTLRLVAMAPIFDTGNSMMYKDVFYFKTRDAIDMRTNGFYANFEKSMNHVSEYSLVDFPKLPSKAEVEELYSQDPSLASVSHKLAMLYGMKVEMAEALAEGMPYCVIAKKQKNLSQMG